MATAGWKKQKPKKAAEGSKNPFLQGMNFDSGNTTITMARGMLFSQKPLRGLRLNPQDQIRHETIHRAWLLFRSQQRRQKVAQLRRLEVSVAETIKVLRATDEKLYARAVSGAREVEKRFPLVMRIPTDTLATRPWNYLWSAIEVPVMGGVVKPG
jgi:large subunit ribosomal protein L40